MPLPRAVARFNRLVTNRLLGPLAPYLPGFGVVVHTGRTSGRRYRTPVNVFRRPGGYTIALTYGPDADWVRNVLAEGGCALETRGRTLRLTRPRLRRDAQRRAVPGPVRLILGLNRVSDFLELDVAEGAATEDGPRGLRRGSPAVPYPESGITTGLISGSSKGGIRPRTSR